MRLPVADMSYEYAFSYARFIGNTESMDLTLDTMDEADGVVEETNSTPRALAGTVSL